MDDLASALWLSARVATTATAVGALLAVPLAFWLAHRRFWGKSILEAILTVPLVLPPTVVGYLLILLMGTRGWLGQWLHQAFGYRFLFSYEAAVIAAVVVGFPLLLLPAKAAFESIEPEMQELARLFGAGPLSTFWHVSLPLARRGIVSGMLLAFARSLGEFGATVMVLGTTPGKRTLPVMIYVEYIDRHAERAWPAVVLLSAVSFVVIAMRNRWLGGRQV
ncbi:MAG: molybdate ABC transporter permease subunit [Phycisphaerales bacterium]|jgi:molybdate transport system permease protein|nr:molybdate ABC transporter permease subunit [Phycisphaerales bacterium]